MSQNSPQAKGSMLNSTAYILIAIAFFAGLLAGSLVGALQPPAVVHQQGGAAVQGQQGHPDNFDENLAKINAEISRNPEEPMNWIFLGNLHFDARHPQQAIDAYTRALELQPGNPDVMVDMGTMYRMNGQPEQAVALYNQVIASDGNHQNAYFNKGVTMMVDLGDAAGAVNTWKALLAIKPDAALSDGKPLAGNLGRLIMDGGSQLENQGRLMEASLAYALAAGEDPALIQAAAERAAAWERNGAPKTAEAASYLRNAISRMSAR